MREEEHRDVALDALDLPHLVVLPAVAGGSDRQHLNMGIPQTSAHDEDCNDEFNEGI
jgi:hypothetical protein